ncbi:hypothetical protein BZA77DRAFT_239236 [Pyronema omphalodes]|nr:hypothetical protein BZA77DRAFT_239236 [Pyronema omphalodes]
MEWQEANRKKAAELQAARELELQRLFQKTECIVCGEKYAKIEMLTTDCGHSYCFSYDCLQAPFMRSFQEKNLFSCCGKPVNIIDAAGLFDDAFVTAYRLLHLERTTPNPLYCSASKCSAFIVPSAIKGTIGKCSQCNKKTCRFCRKGEHKGICTQDMEGQKVRELAKQMGWKECPKCKRIVERRSGCLHMTCRCGGEFCYNCGKLYRECRGTCNRGT